MVTNLYKFLTFFAVRFPHHAVTTTSWQLQISFPGSSASIMHQVSQDVLDYLESTEDSESDPWLADDLWIAWLTVLYAARSYPIPHVLATQRVLGLHPDQVWPQIEARRRAILGSLYPAFFPRNPNCPAKPPKSERRIPVTPLTRTVY